MRKSTIFWGCFLIVLGGLLLINKYYTIESGFTDFISLWPLFLIFWGLSIIKFPEIIRNFLTFLSAVFLALFIFAVITNGLRITKEHIFHWEFHHSKKEKYLEKTKTVNRYFKSNIKSASLKINFGAGELNVRNTDNNSFKVDADYFDFDEGSTPGNQDRIDLEISSADENIINHLGHDREMNMFLPSTPVWYIELNAGAADMNIDLSKLKVPHLKINCGASDLSLTLGNTASIQHIDINCGASDVQIRIPKNSGCQIITNTFLSDKNFQDFTENDGTWVTTNYSTAHNKIDLNIDGGVSDLNVERY